MIPMRFRRLFFSDLKNPIRSLRFSISLLAHGNSDPNSAKPARVTGVPPGPGTGIKIIPTTVTMAPMTILSQRLMSFTREALICKIPVCRGVA